LTIDFVVLDYKSLAVRWWLQIDNSGCKP